MNRDSGDSFEIILFDLGGVLIELGEKPFQHAGKQINAQSWHNLSSAMAFEKGLLSPHEFAKSIQKELKLEEDIDSIIQQFTAWPVGFYEGVQPLLHQLKNQFEVYALTNTNELHWPRLIEEFKLEEYFLQVFSSHLLQLAKPDPAIFQVVLRSLDKQPQQILYFDDNASNIEVARQLGFHAVQVEGFEQLTEALDRLSLTHA
ncbi:HAD family hydrolase [Aliikangiella maris]|uniref:HAD family phosphatase n=2 Tax=Aliikangiella maris TaxID=3162458 RepID=A0ABV3MMB2_9GAMM